MSTVKLKRSAVQGKIPTTSDLELGELAINTYDGKLYLKKDDGTASIVDVTSAAGISDIVQDLTPQLGGDLDTNGNDILFGDNDKAIFGASADLQIFHDGSNSYITDVGTGSIWLKTNGLNISLLDTSNNYMLRANAAGSVDLYHNTSKKLTTTSTGVDVTGKVTAGRFTPTDVISSSEVTFGVYASGAWLNSPSGTFGYLGTAGSGILRWGASNVTITGDVGIGTSSPAASLDVIGNVKSTALEIDHSVDKTITFTRSGANTFSVEHDTSQIYFWNATTSQTPLLFRNNGDVIINETGIDADFRVESNTNTHALFVEGSSGNVGIGTSSPSADGLHIFNASQPDLFMGTTADPDGFRLIYNDTDTVFGNYSNTPLRFITNATERMRIDSSGNVGIGTSSPSQELHVQAGTGLEADIRIAGNGGVSSYLDIFHNSGSAGMWNASNTPLQFATNATERMRIDSSGNVGIGTSSPQRQLHVSGSTGALRLQGTSVGGYIEIVGPSNTNYIGTPAAISSGSTTDLGFYVSSLERMRIDSSGNVGIGVTPSAWSGVVPRALQFQYGCSIAAQSNAYNLHFLRNAYFDNGWKYLNSAPAVRFALNDDAGSGGFSWFTAPSGTAGNAISWSEAMRINSSGNVGIGTTAPATMLHLQYPSYIGKDTVQGLLRLTGQSNTENSGDIPSAGTAIEFYHKWAGGAEYSVARIAGRASQTFDGGLQFDVSQTTGAGQTNFINAMTILDTGRVGIGTTSPSRRLQVYENSSSMVADFRSASGNDSFVSFSNNSSTADQVRLGSSSGNLILSTNYTERMRITSAGNVGIGTSSPAAELHINDATGLSRIRLTGGAAGADNFEIGQGTTGVTNANFEIYDIDAAATRMVIDSSGRVGIGTSSPSEKLEVNGTILSNVSSGNAIVKASGQNIGLLQIVSATGATYAQLSGYQGTLRLNASSSSMPAGDGSQFVLTSSGNVGIGTSSPSTDLDVFGGIRSTSSGGYNQITTSSIGDAAFNNNGNNWLVVKNGVPADAVRIDSSGRVGIGTTSPSYKLDVVTASATQGRFAYDSANYTEVNYDGLNTVGGSMTFKTAGTERMRIGSSGNVGIGTSSPSYKLVVNTSSGPYVTEFYNDNSSTNQYNVSLWRQAASGSATGYVGTGGSAVSNTSFANNFVVGTQSNNPLVFNTNDAERMRIDSSGNVGIGLTNPTSTLHVNGSFAATTKSFVIDHPTKEGMKLRHGSLEGPEDGVYVRGRLTNENVIQLPDYWVGLVDEDSITVQLTAIGGKADIWVDDIINNTIIVGSDTRVNCFYFVQATRKDVEKWDVEY